MQILVLLGMYFDAVVVFVTSQTLLFRLAYLCNLCRAIFRLQLFLSPLSSDVALGKLETGSENVNEVETESTPITWGKSRYYKFGIHAYTANMCSEITVRTQLKTVKLNYSFFTVIWTSILPYIVQCRSVYSSLQLLHCTWSSNQM